LVETLVDVNDKRKQRWRQKVTASRRLGRRKTDAAGLT
jgi:hypothetical protein